MCFPNMFISIILKMMRIFHVVAMMVLSVFGADDYHSSDPAVVAAKIRLLGGLTAPGIRGTIIDHANNISAAQVEAKELNRGRRNIFLALGKMTPEFQAVVTADDRAVKRLRLMDASLERQAESLARRVGGFATEFESNIMKKARDDPESLFGVFKVYNQFVMTEFHQLTQMMDQVTKQLEFQGKVTQTINGAKIKDQWRANSLLGKLITKADTAFTLLLNRKALPLLIGTKYTANTDVAKIGKATLDTITQLKESVVPDVTKRGVDQMKASAEKLKLACQKLAMQSAKDVQRKLAVLRSDLNRMQMKHNTAVNKNFTSLDAALEKAKVDVAKGRADGKRKLDQGAADAEQLAAEFRTNVIDTSGDLQSMLTSEHTVVTSISQEAKLQAQELDSGFGAKIAAMAKNLKSAGAPAGDVNKVQSQIGDAYTSSSVQVSGQLVQDTKARAASALADPSDQSVQLSGMFDGVVGQTRGAVDGDLGSRVGAANAAMQDKQDQILRRTEETADETMAQVDENAAENEAERASVVNSFQAGISQATGAASAVADAGARSSQRASALAQTSLSARDKGLTDLKNQRDTMVGQAMNVRDVAKRLNGGPSAALTAQDKDNESRLHSAFGELNSMRQLAASQGDKFQASATNFITQMVAKATGELPWEAPSVGNLTAKTSALKNASSVYKTSIATMETELNGNMNQIAEQFTSVGGLATVDKQIGQVVAHAQATVSESGRLLLRGIYNQTNSPNAIARFVATNRRLDTDRFFAPALNTSKFDLRAKALTSQVQVLDQKRATTKQGVDEFGHFLESMKLKIQSKMPVDLGDKARLDAVERERNSAVAEVGELQKAMNATILSNLRAANESIANKTENFYRQFQTASIVADSLVQGFADYVAKMVDYEKMTEKQRDATQQALIKSLQQHVADSPVKFTNSTEIDRVNALVRSAMDSADESVEGQKKRKEAADALVAQFGQETADKLFAKYRLMAGNADALSASIAASQEEMTSDRVAGVQGSQLGLEGISAETQLFTTASADVIAAQKTNAAALASKIDQLLSGGSFLTNITGDQLAAILMSVQNSDNVYQTQLSAYKTSTGSNVATLGGVVQSFGELVQGALNRTTDFLDALTKNYTALVVKTDKVTRDPVNALKLDLGRTRDMAENVQNILRQHQLSVGPIEEGLEERIQSLGKRQDDFAANVKKQLDSLVSNIHKLDGDIAVSRESGMRKLRTALYDLTEGFKERALELQSERVSQNSGSLLELQSDYEIRHDMKARISLVKSLLNGKQK